MSQARAMQGHNSNKGITKLRLPFLRQERPSGFLLLTIGLALFAILLLVVGPSVLQARLAVCGIGVLLIGYGAFTPSIFWEEAETELLRTLLGATATRLLVIVLGLGVILWGLLVPLS